MTKLNIYNVECEEPAEPDKRSWWWIGPVILAIGLLLFMCSCATFEYQDAECTIKTATLGKDIVIDPNGMMSTVSPKNQGIIEAIAGFVAGLVAAGI